LDIKAESTPLSHGERNDLKISNEKLISLDERKRLNGHKELK
jgi:hypothetical protein